jgi:hypothetical protein
VRDGRILHIAEAGQLSEYQLLALASGADVAEEAPVAAYPLKGDRT